MVPGEPIRPYPQEIPAKAVALPGSLAFITEDGYSCAPNPQFFDLHQKISDVPYYPHYITD